MRPCCESKHWESGIDICAAYILMIHSEASQPAMSLAETKPVAYRSDFDAGKMLSSQMYKEAGLASLVRNNMASSSISSPMYEFPPSQHSFIVDPRTWCFTCCVFPLFSADLGKARIVTAFVHVNFKYFSERDLRFMLLGGGLPAATQCFRKEILRGHTSSLMIVLLLAQAEEFFHDP